MPLRQRLQLLIADRKKLSSLQVIAGVLFGAGTFLIPYITDTKSFQIILGLGFTSLMMFIMWSINIRIIAPLNNGRFAKQVYKAAQNLNDEVSPTTIRFIENLSERESSIVERSLGFLFFTDSPLFHHDCSFSAKVSYSRPILPWFGDSQCGNLFFDTRSEVETLMDLGILAPSPLPASITFSDNQRDSISLYTLDACIKIDCPNHSPLQCYQATSKAAELYFLCGCSQFQETARVVLADKFVGKGNVYFSKKAIVSDHDRGREVRFESFEKVKPLGELIFNLS